MTSDNMKKKDKLIAIIDTREQAPLDLSPWGIECRVHALQHGDYSLLVPDLRRIFAIERKSLPDYIACCTRERERFERELYALRGYRHKLVLVEGAMDDIALGNYRSRATPASILGSTSSFIAMGVPVLFAGNRTIAAEILARYMMIVAKQVIEFSRVACEQIPEL